MKYLIILLLIIIPIISNGGLANGLTGYWPLDTRDINWTANTVEDRSGNAKTGTMATLTRASRVIGQKKEALRFLGPATSERITAGTTSDFDYTTMTASIFVKTPSGTKVANEYFFGKYNTSGNNRMWALRFNNAGKIGLNTSSNGTAFTLVETTITYPINTWFHLAITTPDKGDTWNVYYNGRYVETITATPAFITKSALLSIGNLTGVDTAGMNGMVDEARIYNRVLDETEIYQLYLFGKKKIKNNLL